MGIIDVVNAILIHDSILKQEVTKIFTDLNIEDLDQQ